jgi:hypothetical protein
VAAHWGIMLLLGVFFVLFYLPVIEEEERHLRNLFPAYAEYAARVPKFLPAWKTPYRRGRGFRLSLYRRNREYQALAGFLAGLVLLAGKLFIGSL